MARAWQALGRPVQAITRGGEAADELQAANIQPIIGDWLAGVDYPLRSGPNSQPPQFALVAIPHRPDDRFGIDTHVVGLRKLLEQQPQLQRIIVLSTTGVYHQCDGSWVDESSECAPTRPGPQLALAAEQWVAQNLPDGRGVSLRLAGIYGPGRIPLVARLREQSPIPIAEGFLNLIHIDDIVRAILALFEFDRPQSLYVLSDGHPVERRQFYEDAARIFKTPPPQFTAAEEGSSRAGRGETNKRISPSRILQELKFELLYPTHIAGLEQAATIT